MLAVVNGALVQIIMASRVIYGVAKLENENHFLAGINAKTQTPVTATLLVGLGVLMLALLFDIRVLASLTSAVTLAIFMLVNLALCRLQGLPRTIMSFVPWLAVVLNGLLLVLALVNI